MRNNHPRLRVFVSLALVWCGMAVVPLRAQTPASGAQSNGRSNAAGALPVVVDYLIGIGDVLSIRVWREPESSADVVVRPDGRISLPLVNEVEVLGLTTEALRAKVTELMLRFHDNPVVSVIPIEINSRQVFITGMVGKPGPYPLMAPTTVLQLIAMAGGLLDFADEKNIIVVRSTEVQPNGVPKSYVVNYDDITHRRKDALKQNIFLMPGDTVIVR